MLPPLPPRVRLQLLQHALRFALADPAQPLRRRDLGAHAAKRVRLAGQRSWHLERGRNGAKDDRMVAVLPVTRERLPPERSTGVGTWT